MHRHDDRRAQPVVADQPFGGEPVVDRAAHRRRQVLAEDRLCAMQYVADGVARAECIQCLGRQQVGIGAGVALGGLPVRADVDRRIRRKCRGGVVVALQAAHQDVRAPVLVQIRHKDLHAGQGRMDIAIDRAGRGNAHRLQLRVAGRIGPAGHGFNGGQFQELLDPARHRRVCCAGLSLAGTINASAKAMTDNTPASIYVLCSARAISSVRCTSSWPPSPSRCAGSSS